MKSEKQKKRIKRALTVSNLYAKKFVPLQLSEGLFKGLLTGIPSSGCWLIYGKEKNGKTTLSLMLADYLSKTGKVLYLQVEEGLGEEIQEPFVDAMKRVGISSDNRNLHTLGDIEFEELQKRLNVRRSPDIIFIDNVTFCDWLKNGGVRKLMREFNKKIFIFLAHEDKDGEPYGATAKMIAKLSTTIFYVNGLKCSVSGRRIKGGEFIINEERAGLIHGASGKTN
jgi:energy-coupling factor transporter ATP-binding protein EcfA2